MKFICSFTEKVTLISGEVTAGEERDILTHILLVIYLLKDIKLRRNLIVLNQNQERCNKQLESAFI